MNVLTGAVLFDGQPPKSLPQEVLGQLLYQRTFGAGMDFEICDVGRGVLRTNRAVQGCWYEFSLSDGRLRVVECRAQDGAEDYIQNIIFVYRSLETENTHSLAWSLAVIGR